MADRFLRLSPLVWWLAAAAAWSSWLCFSRLKRDGIAAALLLASIAAAFGGWHHGRWNRFDSKDLGLFAAEDPRPVCLDAIVLKGPRQIPATEYDALQAMPATDRSRIELRAVAIRDGANWIRASGRVLVYVDGDLPRVAAGDSVRVFAQIVRPLPPQNPADFDAAGYHRADRRLAILEAEHPDAIRVLSSAGGWGLSAGIDELRRASETTLRRGLSSDRYGLGAALLVGLREQIDAERTDAFLVTGTLHILSISGLHLGILAGFLLYPMRLGLVPRTTSVLVVVGVTAVYTLVTDAEPPIVRSAVLVLIVCLATLATREALAFNSLAAAALVVLILNPTDLFHTGAQLSFLAVAALFWASRRWQRRGPADPLERLIARTRPWSVRVARGLGRWCWEMTLVGAAIWLVTLPLVVARFHLVSPVGILLNVLLWLPVAAALVSGFLMLVCGWLLPGAVGFFGWWCELSLDLLEHAVQWSAAMPGSHVWIPGPSDAWLVVGYAGLALWLWLPGGGSARRWCLAAVAAWSAAGLAASQWRTPPDGMVCTVLSVGHGAAVVVELPDGRTVLYDAGRLGPPARVVRSVSNFLWSRRIRTLDAIVISHADLDHYNGVPELLERFDIAAVYVSPEMFDEQIEPLAILAAAIRDQRTPLFTIAAGERLLDGTDCTIDVLHPPAEGIAGNDNAASIVLAIECRGRRLLLPGDLEGIGMQQLLSLPAWDCDAALAPHHGSSHSNPPGFAEWCRPEVVITSGGRHDVSIEMSAAYEERGAKVYHAATSGAVTVEFGEVGVNVERWLEEGERGESGGERGHADGASL